MFRQLFKSLFWVPLIWALSYLPVSATTGQTILILGDSISSAYGIDKDQGWVALLQQRLDSHYPGWQVVNASVSGDTTRTGLHRLPPALQEHQPEIVIIELGGNDGLRGLPFSEVSNSLSEMIEFTQRQNTRVLLTAIRMPPNYGEAYSNQFANIYLQLSDKYQVPLVPRLLDQVADNPELMQPDGIHPTAEGQPQILDNIWTDIEALIRPETVSVHHQLSMPDISASPE